jgi:hypothetical protein
MSFDDRSAEHDRQTSPTDTDSDIPSSALTYCSTCAPLSTPGNTPVPSHLPTPRNSSPPPIPLPGARTPRHRRRAVKAACRRASTTPNRNSTRACPNPTCILASDTSTQKGGKPDPVPTQLKRASSGTSQDDDIPMVTERRRKSRLQLPVDNDEECDGA